MEMGIEKERIRHGEEGEGEGMSFYKYTAKRNLKVTLTFVSVANKMALLHKFFCTLGSGYMCV